MSLTANDASTSDTSSGVASVGEKTYTTLAEAITAADAGDKVNLLTNVTEDVTVASGKNITLNLNGHTLTNVSGHTITNSGTLTITDSSVNKTGTIDNVTHQKAPVENLQGATCTIEKANIKRSNEAGTYSPDNANENSYYYIENFGTMTIGAEGGNASDVIVSSAGGYSSLVHNGWFSGDKNVSGVDATMTINAGSFAGGKNTIKNDDYGSLTINGGSFENSNQAAVFNVNKATINGGSFESAAEGVVYTAAYDKKMDWGVTSVYGGEFKSVGTSDFSLCNKGAVPTVTVHGGTFSKDPSAYVVSGYIALQNDKGTYSVNGIVKVGDKYYTSLQDAINAAAKGATVTMLSDVTLSDEDKSINVAQNQDVILDLNGKTIARTSKTAGAVTVDGGTLVVKDSTAKQPTVSGSDVAYEGGAISGLKAVYVGSGGSFTLESGKIESTGDDTTANVYYAITSAGNTTSGTTDSVESAVNIKGGYVVAKQCAVYVKGKGATANVTGGVLKSTANSVISGEGEVTALVYGSAKLIGASETAPILNLTEKTGEGAGTFTVIGGTFSKLPDYVDGGYTAVKDSDGNYVVVKQASSAESTDGTAAGSATTDGNVEISGTQELADDAVSAAEAVKGMKEDLSIEGDKETVTADFAGTKVEANSNQVAALNEVKKAVADNAGAKVDVNLVVKADTNVAVDDKIAEKAKASGSEVVPFDLSVDMVTTVKVGNETKASASVPVVETASDITVTITVDPQIIKGKRVSIARNHDDEVSILSADANYETGAVTFKNGKFSKFGIVLTDENTSYKLPAERPTIDNSAYGSSDGYAFAGWYQDAQRTIPCEKGQAYDNAFPKFVKISDLIEFLGGSLRTDLTGEDDFTKTSLRFGYEMKVPAGATLNADEWGWTYANPETDKSGFVKAVNYWLTDGNGAITNLVIKSINKSGLADDEKTKVGSFSTSYQVTAQIGYTTADGTSVLVKDETQARSVEQVANLILSNPLASAAETTYANGILGKN